MDLWKSLKEWWRRRHDQRLVKFLKNLDQGDQFLAVYYLMQQMPKEQRERYLIYYDYKQLREELITRELIIMTQMEDEYE